MHWTWVNPWNEPTSMVETAIAATMSEEEYDMVLSTGTDFDMGYVIADAYNKCNEMGVSVSAQFPGEAPYFSSGPER